MEYDIRCRYNMRNAYQEELNAIVTEYAIKAIGDYAFTCDEFQYVLRNYRKPLNPNLTICEAEIRTLGLSRLNRITVSSPCSIMPCS